MYPKSGQCQYQSTVQREALQEAQANYTVAVVGDVTAEDELWDTYAEWARRGLRDKLVESETFTRVIEGQAGSPPPDALIVTARIVEADRGNAAARWIVGFGAGRAHITSEIELSEADGKDLGNFSVRRAYSGGLGIGGAGLLDMEELARLVGEETADAIVEWTVSGNLESSD